MASQKTVTTVIRLVINAGQAKPAPPVGPALGQHGLNLMAFCKDFNARTQHIKPDVPVPALITAYSGAHLTSYPPLSFLALHTHSTSRPLLRPLPPRSSCHQDRSFDFIIKSPPTSYFLKRAAGLSLGGGEAGHQMVGEVSLKHVYEIAKIKQQDPGCSYIPLESICRSIIGTARSMGIQVKKSLEVPSST
ncbi:unnamed protein product [Closterium sp. Naga37s-1]|nr:unnamed protein product [Closterium sp. Naga37s-1]